MPENVLLDTFDVVVLINSYVKNQYFFKYLKSENVDFCLSKGSAYELTDVTYVPYAGQIRLVHSDLNIVDLPPTWDLFLATKNDKKIFSNSFLHAVFPHLWVDLKKEDFFDNYFKKVFTDMDPALEKHYLAILDRDGLPPPHTLIGLNKDDYPRYCEALAEAFAKDVEMRDKNITLPRVTLSLLGGGTRPNRDSSGVTYVSSFIAKSSGISIKNFNKMCGPFAYVRYCAGMHLSMVTSSEKIIPTRILNGKKFSPIVNKTHYADFDSNIKARLLCLYSIKMQHQKNISPNNRNAQVDGTRLMHLPDVSLMSVDGPVYRAISSCKILPDFFVEKLMPNGYFWCYLIKKYSVPETLWPSFLDKAVLEAYLISDKIDPNFSAYIAGVTALPRNP